MADSHTHPVRVGPFEVYSDSLGKGGQRVVRAAVCKSPSGGVAVGEHVALMEAATAEAEILRSLDHPHILKYRHEFVDPKDPEQRPYLVVELLKGETLERRLAGWKKDSEAGRAPWAEIRQIFGQLLLALRYLEERRIAHNDLKPSNVFLTQEGGVRLIDFGIAHRIGSGERPAAGGHVGTFNYMAPDYFLGSAAEFQPDIVSDIFSFGIMLYEAMSGKLPFDPMNSAPDCSHFWRARAEGSRGGFRLQFPSPLFMIFPHAKECIANCLKVARSDRYQEFVSVARAFKNIAPKRYAKLNGGELDEYQLETYLSQGQFGMVFEARHVRGGRPMPPVALKYLTRQGKEARERFSREVQFLKENPHENLVRYVDDLEDPGTADPRPVLALELLQDMPHASLEQRIHNSRDGLPAKDVLKWFGGYLSCLHHLHCCGISHRDIKPQNLYAPDDPDGAAKIFDLGSITDEEAHLTGRLPPSTWQYNPPQFFLGKQLYGSRGGAEFDVYSIGVSLFFALTKELPLPAIRGQGRDTEARNLDSLARFTERALKGRDEHERLLRFEHPVFEEWPGLESLIRKALNYEPIDRYHSAQEMREALAAVLLGSQDTTQDSAGPGGTDAHRTQALIDWAGPKLTEEEEVTFRSLLERATEALVHMDATEAAELCREALTLVPAGDAAEQPLLLLELSIGIAFAQLSAAEGRFQSAQREVETLLKTPGIPAAASGSPALLEGLRAEILDRERQFIENLHQGTLMLEQLNAAECLRVAGAVLLVDPDSKEALRLFDLAAGWAEAEEAMRLRCWDLAEAAVSRLEKDFPVDEHVARFRFKLAREVEGRRNDAALQIERAKRSLESENFLDCLEASSSVVDEFASHQEALEVFDLASRCLKEQWQAKERELLSRVSMLREALSKRGHDQTLERTLKVAEGRIAEFVLTQGMLHLEVSAPVLIREGRFAELVAACQEFLRLDPECVRVLELRSLAEGLVQAEAFIRDRMWTEAVLKLEPLQRVRPGCIRGAVMLVTCRWEQARSEREQDSLCHLRRARECAQRRDISACALDCREALAYQPRSPEARALLAETRVLARAQLHGWLADWPGAVRVLLEHPPAPSDAFVPAALLDAQQEAAAQLAAREKSLQRGAESCASGDYENAIACYRAALDLGSPGGIRDAWLLGADAAGDAVKGIWLASGLRAARSEQSVGSLERGLSSLQSLIQAFPNHPLVQASLQEVTFAKAAAEARSFCEGKLQEGHECVITGNYADCVKACDEILRRDPDGDLAAQATDLRAVAQALLQAGRLASEKSWEDCAAVLRVAAGRYLPHRLLLMARLEVAQARLEETRARGGMATPQVEAKHAIEESRPEAAIPQKQRAQVARLLEQARSSLLRGDLAAARQILDAARVDCPNETRIADLLKLSDVLEEAQTAAQAGRQVQAATLLERVLDSYPEEPALLSSLERYRNEASSDRLRAEVAGTLRETEERISEGRFDLALERVGKLRQLAPEVPEMDALSRLIPLLEQVSEQEAQGRWEAAEALLLGADMDLMAQAPYRAAFDRINGKLDLKERAEKLETLLRESRTALDALDFAAAFRVADRACRLYPGDARASAMRALSSDLLDAWRVGSDGGGWDAARHHLQALRSRYPADPAVENALRGASEMRYTVAERQVAPASASEPATSPIRSTSEAASIPMKAGTGSGRVLTLIAASLAACFLTYLVLRLAGLIG